MLLGVAGVNATPSAQPAFATAVHLLSRINIWFWLWKDYLYEVKSFQEWRLIIIVYFGSSWSWWKSLFLGCSVPLMIPCLRRETWLEHTSGIRRGMISQNPFSQIIGISGICVSLVVSVLGLTGCFFSLSYPPFHFICVNLKLIFSSTQDSCVAWSMFIAALYSLQRKFREGQLLLAVEDGRWTFLSPLVKIFQSLEIPYKNMMDLPAVLSWCHDGLAITEFQ